MNIDELKERLGKVKFGLDCVVCCGIAPYSYWKIHNFDHNQHKIRKGYPYLSKRAHIYINKYIKETRIMYMDKYLYDIWARDCYCKYQDAMEKKRLKRERERERKIIHDLIQKRGRFGLFDSEIDRILYGYYVDEGKITKSASEKNFEKYAPIFFVALICVGIILFAVYIGNPIYFVLSVIFCAGTVILGLTGHGR